LKKRVKSKKSILHLTDGYEKSISNVMKWRWNQIATSMFTVIKREYSATENKKEFRWVHKISGSGNISVFRFLPNYL
jgi:hypothetical protein